MTNACVAEEEPHLKPVQVCIPIDCTQFCEVCCLCLQKRKLCYWFVCCDLPKQLTQAPPYTAKNNMQTAAVCNLVENLFALVRDNLLWTGRKACPSPDRSFRHCLLLECFWAVLENDVSLTTKTRPHRKNLACSCMSICKFQCKAASGLALEVQNPKHNNHRLKLLWATGSLHGVYLSVMHHVISILHMED